MALISASSLVWDLGEGVRIGDRWELVVRLSGEEEMFKGAIDASCEMGAESLGVMASEPSSFGSFCSVEEGPVAGGGADWHMRSTSSNCPVKLPSPKLASTSSNCAARLPARPGEP